MCNSVNAQTMGMVPDRVFFSSGASVTASGSTVTISGAFSITDEGKTLVVYNSIPTDFPSGYVWGPYADYADLIANAPHTASRAYKVTDTGLFYMWEGACGSFVEIKQYETIAVTIINYIDANTVDTDYTFPVSLSSLDAVMGTDNFTFLQDAVDHCLDNKLDLCIPDGDYLLLFSDVPANLKQQIKLAKGSSSSLTITGESKENTRLFYEYKTEITGVIYGLGFTNPVNTNEHFARLNTLQIAGPDYKPKLRGIPSISTTASVTTAVNNHALYMANADLELNSVIIDGGELKNFSIAIGFDAISSSPSTYRPIYLTVADSYIARCAAIALGAQGDRPVLNVSDTTLYNIGMIGSPEFCRPYGGTVYLDHQTTYSFRNVIFDNCHRHALQLIGGASSTKPTCYQELINCKFFNSGTVFTDTEYDNTRILDCEINDSTGFTIGNSCLVANTTFKDSLAVALTVAAGSDPVDLTVANCRFIRKPAFTYFLTATAPFLTATFDNCLFEGQPSATDAFTFITMSGKQSLIIRNSRATDHVLRFMVMDTETKALLENNTFEVVPTTQETIVLSDDNCSLELINNRFTGIKPIKVVSGTYTHGGQITGHGNYFENMASFHNQLAAAGTPYFQKLLGRQSYYPTLIGLDSAVFNGFLSQVNFNYDFYKIDRDTDTPTTPVEIDYIAFNASSSLSATGKGLFCGLVRIMSIHDPSTQGDIVIKNNTNLATGNIHTFDGNDYTMKQNEVLEFYYDSDTQFWNMVR